MNTLIEILLLLFWIGYAGLMVWLLRTHVSDRLATGDPLQGEARCIPPAMK